MTEYSYTLIYKPESDAIDITQWVDRIDAIEVGSGEIRSSKIRLNADQGRFITKKLDLSWTGGSGSLSVGQTITTTGNFWKGTLLEIMSGNSTAGKGRFAENAETFVDGVQTLDNGSGWTASYTTASLDPQNRPIIDQFDKLHLTITDRNADTYDVIYEVDNVRPIQNSQVGSLVEVESLGMEWQMTKSPFAKPYFEESAFMVSDNICAIYNNDTAGSLTPIVIDHDNNFADSGFNELAKYTANVYPFNLRDQSVYSALIETLDRSGSSVPSGGAGDFFEIGFEDDLTDPNFNTIKFRGFISGSPPDQSSVPTITDTAALNPGEEDGGIESTPAFVQGTWGADGIGTLPWKNGMFQGALEIWNLYPNHQSGVTYPTGAIVTLPDTTDSQGDLEHYKANQSTSATPPDGGVTWTPYQFDTFLATEVNIPGQYSEWTNLLASEWESCFANPNGTLQDDPPLGTSVHAWDMNQVIVDGTFKRTWVDYRTNDPANIPTQYKYGSNFYRGFRVLVDASLGAPVGDFVGFDNKVVQQRVNGTWRTFRDPALNNLVAVDDESKVFQYDGADWVVVSGNSEENDCYHSIYEISNSQGFNDKNDGGGSNFGIFSAIQVESRYKTTDNVPVFTRTTDTYYRQGAWINFRFPFPSNAYNSNTLGQYFGKTTGDNEPATLDSGNMHLAHDGTKAFNNVESQDLGPLDAVRFKTHFQWSNDIDGSGIPVRFGNFKCRCFMMDTSDNVVIHDFTIDFNSVWSQTITLPFKEFKVYRGRKPWAYDTAVSSVFLQQLEILNVFEWKNIQKIGFCWLAPYDDDGRYQPWGQVSAHIPSIESFTLGQLLRGFNIKWSIDSFEFAKIGLALSTPVTVGRPIFLPFENQPQIQNMFQLRQHNDAMLEIAQFRRVRYDIVTEGTCKEKFGDSLILENSWLVRDSARGETNPGDNDGDPNTVKLVCKRIRYEITKPSNGPGGFLRYIEGVKRFIT